MITRRHALSALAAPVFAQRRQRPNFVFILIDDLRWDALGCTGHPFAKTPHIDRIGREGAILRNAFVTTPLCSPARSSYLTGQYVHTTGIRGNGDNAARSHELVTFPRLLRDAGYRTAYTGKWHMGNDDSPRPGFDRWISFRGQGRYVDPEFNIDGKRETVPGYMTDLLSSRAAEFIRGEHRAPWCLYLAHKAVHGPFTPAARHAQLYSDVPIPRAPSTQDTLDGKPALRGEGGGRRPAAPNDELVRNQLRCLASIDDGVGEILKALEETRQLDNTVVVFTSDNGYLWGEHGLGDKRAAYEESIRIPMLVRYPALVRAGSEPAAMALNIDIAPTFLDLAGVRRPAAMHGQSLVPVLRGARSRFRASFLAEYFEERQFPRIPTWQAVRTERWKYITYPDRAGADELYDLSADRYELKNLAGDAAAARELSSMRRELAALLRRTRA